MSNLTKRALEASLKKLLLKKPLDKITISDIADDCGMNRMTFYYHFQDIYDLIAWSFDEDAEKILAGKKSYETWQEGYLAIFLSILENKPLIMNVYRSVSRDQLEQFLFKVSYRLLRNVVEEEDKERVVSEEDKDFIANFYKAPWSQLGAEIMNPIGCGDCHDPKTMDLKITRPALIEAFQRQGKDITKATQQEMRSLVCAQCHVEYYFKGEGKYLTFPWDKGMTMEDAEAYYDESDYYDYIHALSRAPILKAQHPGYELSMQGIHAQRGVACADCHMPYKAEGGIKYTDHHITSPLQYIDRTCQVCHRESEETLRQNVYERQRKVNEVRNKLEDELLHAHIEAEFAWKKGATETEMAPVLKFIRQSQWRWDYGVASHGASFHAPQEVTRILSAGLERAMKARLALSRILAKHGYTDEVPMPDISTKEKAQRYIGLNPEELHRKKGEFLKTVVPKWIEEARKKNRIMTADASRS